MNSSPMVVTQNQITEKGLEPRVGLVLVLELVITSPNLALKLTTQFQSFLSVWDL